MWALRQSTSSISVEDPVEIRAEYFNGWMHRSKEVYNVPDIVHQSSLARFAHPVSSPSPSQSAMGAATGGELTPSGKQFKDTTVQNDSSTALLAKNDTGAEASAATTSVTLGTGTLATDARTSPLTPSNVHALQPTREDDIHVTPPNSVTESTTDEDMDQFEQQIMFDQWRFLDIHEEQLKNAMIANSSLQPPLDNQQREQLIRAYYALEYEIAARILTIGRRKDLDDITEETNVSLLFCRRQFDNITRIMQTIESESGSFHDKLVSACQRFLSSLTDETGMVNTSNTDRTEFYKATVAACLQNIYFFDSKLAQEYVGIIFLFKHRIKPLGHDTTSLKETMRCGAAMLSYWGSIPNRAERRYLELAAPYILDIDENFSGSLKQVSAVLPKTKKTKAAWESKYKQVLGRNQMDGIITSDQIGQLIQAIMNSTKDLMAWCRQLVESCRIDTFDSQIGKKEAAVIHQDALLQTLGDFVAPYVDMSNNDYSQVAQRLVGPLKTFLAVSSRNQT